MFIQRTASQRRTECPLSEHAAAPSASTAGDGRAEPKAPAANAFISAAEVGDGAHSLAAAAAARGPTSAGLCSIHTLTSMVIRRGGDPGRVTPRASAWSSFLRGLHGGPSCCVPWSNRPSKARCLPAMGNDTYTPSPSPSPSLLRGSTTPQPKSSVDTGITSVGEPDEVR